MREKVCFVAMGFGIKMDYQNSKEVDLDKIYNDVIKDLFEKDMHNYKLIRADEIAGSSIIDVGMYALLLNADLVIADITTLNPNAIYELGVRHAVRPFSTIIMAQKSCKIPFDLDHSRFLIYEDIGDNLEDADASKIQLQLKEFIKESEKEEPDSPLYTYLPEIKPPIISDEKYKKIIEAAENKTDTISQLIESSQDDMSNNEFDSAKKTLRHLHTLLPNNEYVIQQLALATYKSESPNATKALDSALDIIKKLCPESSLDIETLGITGAIYKRLYRLNRNFDYLDESTYYYKRGYVIKNDYYNGENYANCLMLKMLDPSLAQTDKNYIKYECKTVYENIIEIINNTMDEGESDIWMYATLAVCNYCLKNESDFKKYEKEFYDKCSVDWQKETYKQTINELEPVVNL